MKYHDIVHDDMLNGEGLRVTLYVSGCSHHCKECQNPITWDHLDGKEFGLAEVKEITDQMDQDYISGITLSGGDPLNEHNLSAILELTDYLRTRYGDKKTIWIYTGYTLEQILDNRDDPLNTLRRKIISNCDVLVDDRFEIDLLDVKYEYAGSTNQRVIDLKKTEKNGWKVVPYSHRLKLGKPMDDRVVKNKCGCCN